MIQIRPALLEDADALCDAHVSGWRSGYRGLFPDAYLDCNEFESRRREIWHHGAWIGADDQTLFAGLLDGRVLGFAHVGTERVDNDETGRGEVFGFYLHPDAWGSGLATELMLAAEDALRTLLFDEAVLWVLRDNPRGRSFYEKAGWAWSGQESLWAAPELTGAPKPDPIAEVMYQRTL